MADSKQVKDLNDNFLQCSICMDGYKNPRMLPCIHSFCLQCLEKRKSGLQNQSFTCPKCRKPTTLPENGVKDLPSNFLLVSLMERLNMADSPSGASSLRICHFCQGSEGIQLCLDCKFHICSTCKKVHDQIPDTGDHTVIPIDKLADAKFMTEILAAQIPRCPDHVKEKLRFFCTSCSKLVCRDCTIIDHRGHECIEAEKRFDIVKGRLEAALRGSEDEAKSVRQIHVKVTAATENVDKHVRDAQREVDEQYNKLSQKLKSDRDALKHQLDEIGRKECVSFVKSKDEVANWMDATKNTQTVTQMMLEANNRWGMIEMEKYILDAFKKSSEEEKILERPPVERKSVTRFNITTTRNNNGDGAGKEGSAITKRNMIGTMDCGIRASSGKAIKNWKLKLDDRY